MIDDFFFEYLTRHVADSYSQLAQDLWVLAALQHKRDGYFIEVGAYDGVNLSNTLLLEHAGWTGILVEPNPDAFSLLKAQRRAIAVQNCVWNTDGEIVTMEKVLTKPELSRITAVDTKSDHDIFGARAHHEIVKVETITPTTLLEQNGVPKIIDYLSVDIEGGEIEVLRAFPFDTYSVRLASIEHNYTKQREEIHDLMTQLGFVRVLTEFSKFDDWYVRPDLVPELGPLPDDAEDALFKDLLAIENRPSPSVDCAQSVLGIALQLRRLERMPEARRLLEAYLGHQPFDHLAMCRLADMEYAEGRTEQAENLYVQASKAAPDLPVARLGLAQLKLQEKLLEEALEIAQNVQERFPENKTAIGISARALLRMGRLEDCVAVSLEAIRRGDLPPKFVATMLRKLRDKGLLAEEVAVLRAHHGVNTHDADLNSSLLNTLIRWRRGDGSIGPPGPQGRDFERRIKIAMQGAHCVANLPKVEGAGDVVEVSGSRFQRMFDGTLVPEHGYYGAWMTRLIAQLNGHHEPQEERVFFHVMDHIEGGFILELGAFWGFYTAAFLRRFPGKSDAFLVEPAVLNAAVGLETLRVNGLKACMQLGYFGTAHRNLNDQKISDDLAFSPTKFDVCDFFEREQLSEITIFHADVQGGERRLLEEIETLLRQRAIKYLFISTHGPKTHVSVLNAIKKVGYFLIAEHDNLESFSFDGLVVARSPDVTDVGFVDLPLRTTSVDTAPDPVGQTPSTISDKVLVIKNSGEGFWANIEHAVWHLVLAEALERKPIIHWGSGGFYARAGYEAFQLYFEPLNELRISDLAGGTFYPDYWTSQNIEKQLPITGEVSHLLTQRHAWLKQMTKDAPDATEFRLDVVNALATRPEATSIVAMNYAHLEEFRELLPEESEYKSMHADDVRRAVFRKYFRLNETVSQEIAKRRSAIIPSGVKVAAVHARATDKQHKESMNPIMNEMIMEEAERWLAENNGKLFVMTESNLELQKFLDRFGDQVVMQNCFRSDAALTPNFRHPEADGFESGMSILTDTYIAASCDYFIGYSKSNVVSYVAAISDLPADKIHLVDMEYRAV